MNDPRPAPDDTQPTLSVTQPLTAVPQRTGIPRWIYGVLLMVASASLIATLLWLPLTIQPMQVTAAVTRSIALIVNGQRTDANSSAATVGDFLREQRITLLPEDALSDPLTADLRSLEVITVARARDVALVIEGEEVRLRTPFTTPADILKQAQIVLHEDDAVTLDGIAVEPAEVLLWQLPTSRIEVNYALAVTIVDAATITSLITTANTVGDALFAANVQLYLSDQVLPAIASTLQPDTQIVITRAQPLTIVVDSTRLETRAMGGTVADALAESGVSLLGLDYVIPAESDVVVAGMTISVVRVTEDLLTTEREIAPETVYIADDRLPLDSQTVVNAGASGIARQVTRVRYADGFEISREDEGEEIVRAAISREVHYGTQIVLNTLTTADGTFEYWRKMRVYATSYHPAALGGDNVTAIGETLRKGIVGADPSLIPYRTSIYVEGYGTGMIADTGGRRSSPYWIDLGYSDEDFLGWHRYVDIYLLTPVPPNFPIRIPPFTPLRGTSGY